MRIPPYRGLVVPFIAQRQLAAIPSPAPNRGCHVAVLAALGIPAGNSAEIAASFAEASQAYVDNPTALHLRAMNMLFEGLKEKGALVIVPSSAVDTMNLGAMSGVVALAQNSAPKEK